MAWLLLMMAAACPVAAQVATNSKEEPAKAKEIRSIDAKAAIAPAAPVLPAEIVAALQERRFADAATALEKLAAASKSPADVSYYALIQAIAKRLDGKADDARALLSKAIAVAPDGIWTPKLRLELAGVELATGRQAEAEALARTEAEHLLAGDRKDRLAEVYHAFAKRLLKPDNAITPPDPNTAYDLLVQARSLAKSETLRARLLFEMAGASAQANNFARAFQDDSAYLNEYPKGADRLDARFRLGATEQSLGMIPQARLRWTDLARELDVKDRPKGSDAIRARALFAIAHTYGIPSPGDDVSLNLGVAALRRYLNDYPSQDASATAAYEIGLSFLNRGKSDQALEALTRFLKEEGFKAESDESKRTFAQLSMTATFQIGQVLQGQQKFDEAIAAWKGYLAKFPNGPQSADAQRAILDTQLLIAEDHKSHDRYDEARAAWLGFVAQNPLDGRVPEVLFKVGEAFEIQKKFDQAIVAWEPLLSRYPATEPTAHAQFQIAAIEQDEKGDLEKAIELFRRVNVDPWRTQAQGRIGAMESVALNVVTPRVFRSGETAHLEVETRNLAKLTFSAYKLNAESYFRKKRSLENVESLDISLVAPDAEWSVSVPKYARYKTIETKYDLPKLDLPGVYVVKVTDEKELQATSLVIGSDIDAIIKTSRDQLLVFVQDMKTGQGRPNARVIVGEGENVVFEGNTGPDGVLLQGWPQPKNPNADLSYLVIDGASVAGTSFNLPAKVAQGIVAKAFLYTDRPAYRPGQDVAIKGIIREVADGQYANVPKAVYNLEVTDSRGRRIVSRPVTLSDFGTFQEDLALEEATPVGAYRIRVFQPGKSDFNGGFIVQSYQLEKIDLSFDLKQTVFFRGETIATDLVAKYQYGAPVVAHPVAVQLPDGRSLQGVTDAEGKFHVEFPTEGFAEEQALTIVAQLPQDNVATAANVMLAIRALALDLKTNRDVFLNGETFQVKVRSNDALGKPVGESVSVALVKVIVQNGRTNERETSRKSVATDPKTGEASVSFRADDEDGGDYIVRASGTDRFKNPIVIDKHLTISGKDDSEKLRILADRQSFKVGEEAAINLHNKGKAGTTLLTWEGDRVLSYKIVPLGEGDNPVKWTVDGAQFPNFTLNASRMTGEKFERAELYVEVKRELQVTLQPLKTSVAPGEEVEVEITTVDQLGRPVSAELSLALVDRSLLRIFGDKLPPIGSFFYDQTRNGSFQTESTNTFRYDPETTPVSRAVVEEADRAQAEALNGIAGEKLAEIAKGQVALNAPAAVPEPTAPAKESQDFFAGGRDGMMGGMGGDGGRPGADKSPAQKTEMADAPMAPAPASAPAPVALGLNYTMSAKDTTRELGRTRSKRKAGLEAAANAPRERFTETAYWNPSVVTDKAGKAKVKFKAPMALSDYQFTARGVTGSDTLVGQSTASLLVKKDFFVDLKLPTTLTQGDKPRFIAQVHHVGIVGPIDLKLSLYSGEREQVYPKTIEVKGDGVEQVLFDPFEVPDAENVRITLEATAGEGKKDDLVVEVPVRPWGVQALASASGTANSDATVFVGLPAGRAYENPEMLVVVSPTLKRMLVELALGRDAFVLNERLDRCIFPPSPITTADRASELLAATSALSYLSTTPGANAAPEAARLTERIRDLVAELVSLQADDGGWPWVASTTNAQPRPSDRLTSARALWALASAEPLGYVTDAGTLDRASNYLTQVYAQIQAGDHETRAAVLHALSTRGKANFETANSLNRIRQSLSDTALASLALTFVNLDRVPLAGEILDILDGRVKSEASTPGSPPRKYWGGAANRSTVETTSLAALAYAKARPQSPELQGAVDWLLAHRGEFGWRPLKAKGPALAALAAFYGKAAGAEDRYNLVVKVNDAEVYRAQVVGGNEGKAILVPTKSLKVGDKNRVQFDIEGRGTFGYSVTLTGFTRDFGPDQNRANRTSLIARRAYFPADPEFNGKALPTGFGVTINPTPFENLATQVPFGGRARVKIEAYRNAPANLPEWEREFLVLEEHLPAGTTFIEGSLQSNAAHHTVGDGLLTLYFAPDQWPGEVRYDVYGYLPGEYRALPASIRNAYDLGRGHLSDVGSLKVLSPGEKSTDPYKPTPDEQLARGKALFEANRYAEAAIPLEEIFNGYTLRDDVAKEAARMLLLIHIKEYDARKVVQYFEVVKEKAPELVLTFDDLLVIGRAYRDIKEYERAFLVWRGVAEASYLEDARVGEVLRQRGKTLEAISYLISLWREYPNSASIESDFYALSQVLAKRAGEAFTNPAIRRELAEAGITRSELLLQSIRLIQVFLSQSPTNPLADEASLGLVGCFLDLEQFPAVVKLSARFAKLYPKSTFLDSFQYSDALGEFHLGHYDRAVEVAETIAKATYKDAAGVDQPSPNKWQAVYILGQIFDARRQPGKAIDYYKQVEQQFSDAADAIRSFTRKDLKIPEVSVVKAANVAVGGVEAAPPAAPARGANAEPSKKPEVKLDYRNIAEADVKVYPVDLMRLYLTRRNLDAIAGIDLAGITPLHEATIALGKGEDYADKIKSIDLPLKNEGAYLVMVRGENLYASGIVLVTGLELEVLEEPESGRVRVTVRDANTKEYVPKVQVKVIGNHNRDFISGETDLRGVFVAEGVSGEAAAVARKGKSQYAFYRGTTNLAPQKPAEGMQGQRGAPDANQSLDQNLRIQNDANRSRQVEQLERRIQAPPAGMPGNNQRGAAAGGFR